MLEEIGLSIALELIGQAAKFFGVSVEDIRQKISKSLKNRQTSKERELTKIQTIKRENIAQLGLSNHLIRTYYENLHSRKEHDIEAFGLKIRGKTIDTTFTSKSSWGKINENLTSKSICSLWNKDVQNEIIPYEDGLKTLEQIIASGSKLWNDPIYRLQWVQADNNNFRAKFSIDSFFSYRLGIGRLNDETIQALINNDKDNILLASRPETISKKDLQILIETVLQKQSKSLPLRAKYLSDLKMVQSPNERMCAGGVSVLVAAKLREKGYKLYLHRRGDKVSENRHALGVIPHAFHQPLIHKNHDLQLENTVFREIYEEMFGGEEKVNRNPDLHIDSKWFYSVSAPLKWLKDNPTKWSLQCTGFGYNLASGNYDFAILLCIESPAFLEKFESQMMVNWEVATEKMLVNGVFYDTNMPIIETVNSSDRDQIELKLNNARWTSVGLYSFVQGIRALAQIDPKNVKLPEFSTTMDE